MFLDEGDLPGPAPGFELLFTRDGGVHVGKLLKMNQSVHPMFGAEATQGARPMLVQSRHQVGCHSDIYRTVPAAGEDVDTGVSGHFPKLPCSWMLNQVQHDVMGAA